MGGGGTKDLSKKGTTRNCIVDRNKGADKKFKVDQHCITKPSVLV